MIVKEEVVEGGIPEARAERGSALESSVHPVKHDPEERKFTLSESSVRRRLAAIDIKPTVVSLDGEIASKTISRDFFSARYGGSSQSTFPRIGPAKKELHDIDHVAFFKRDWNPELPVRPGEPGLAFCRHPEIHGVMPLFVRKAEHSWQYFGEYRIHKVAPLTAEEWASQSEKMRNVWLDEGFMKLKWGQASRARYVFRERHAGQDPETKEELAELKGIVKSNAWCKITRSLIERALEDGNEAIHVCVLECVSYRADFQTELVAGYERESWKTFPASSCRKRTSCKKDEDVKPAIEENEVRETKRPRRH